MEGGGNVGPAPTAFEVVEECPGGHAHALADTTDMDLGDCQREEH